MGILNFFRHTNYNEAKNKNVGVCEKTISNINVVNLINFLNSANVNLNIKVKECGGFLDEIYIKNRQTVKNALDVLQHCIYPLDEYISIVLIDEENYNNKEYLMNEDIRVADFLNIIESGVFFLVEQKKKYVINDKIDQHNLCCDQISCIEETWRYLVAFKNHLPDKYAVSFLNLRLSKTDSQ